MYPLCNLYMCMYVFISIFIYIYHIYVNMRVYIIYSISCIVYVCMLLCMFVRLSVYMDTCICSFIYLLFYRYICRLLKRRHSSQHRKHTLFVYINTYILYFQYASTFIWINLHIITSAPTSELRPIFKGRWTLPNIRRINFINLL